MTDQSEDVTPGDALLQVGPPSSIDMTSPILPVRLEGSFVSDQCKGSSTGRPKDSMNLAVSATGKPI